MWCPRWVSPLRVAPKRLGRVGSAGLPGLFFAQAGASSPAPARIRGGPLSRPRRRARAATWLCPSDRRISTLHPPLRSVQRTPNACCPSEGATRPGYSRLRRLRANRLPRAAPCSISLPDRPIARSRRPAITAAFGLLGNASRSRVAALCRPASGSPSPSIVRRTLRHLQTFPPSAERALWVPVPMRL